MKKSEFYTEVARAFKLADDTGCNDVVKCWDKLMDIHRCSLGSGPVNYTFAIAVVEGKAVFEGDILYYKNGNKVVAHKDFTSCWSSCSWNPPKPKTVMVEMDVEDAECFRDGYLGTTAAIHNRIARYIDAALSNQSLESLKT